MIDGAAIERAERVLQITYADADAPRQLRAYQVDYAAFSAWLTDRRHVVEREYVRAYRAADPRLHAAYATLLMHFFLVGLVAGRHQQEEIV